MEGEYHAKDDSSMPALREHGDLHARLQERVRQHRSSVQLLPQVLQGRDQERAGPPSQEVARSDECGPARRQWFRHRAGEGRVPRLPQANKCPAPQQATGRHEYEEEVTHANQHPPKTQKPG